MKKVYEVTSWGENIRLTAHLGLYQQSDFMGNTMPGLAITLVDEDGEPYGDLTVNFGEFIGQKNWAYVDMNNCGNVIAQLPLGRDTGFTKHSGFCVYPCFELSEDFLRDAAEDSVYGKDDATGEDWYKIYSRKYDEYFRELEKE